VGGKIRPTPARAVSRRGIHYPIAMEGALKLKEISYIHAEAYAAGRAQARAPCIVDKSMPVIAIAPKDALLEKLKSNLQEVRARGGELHVLAIRTRAWWRPRRPRDSHARSRGNPLAHPAYRSAATARYHTALERGNDVDKPRNLAKSVTVE